jgi:hypothetical protein
MDASRAPLPGHVDRLTPLDEESQGPDADDERGLQLDIGAEELEARVPVSGLSPGWRLPWAVLSLQVSAVVDVIGVTCLGAARGIDTPERRGNHPQSEERDRENHRA